MLQSEPPLLSLKFMWPSKLRLSMCANQVSHWEVWPHSLSSFFIQLSDLRHWKVRLHTHWVRKTFLKPRSWCPNWHFPFFDDLCSLRFRTKFSVFLPVVGRYFIICFNCTIESKWVFYHYHRHWVGFSYSILYVWFRRWLFSSNGLRILISSLGSWGEELAGRVTNSIIFCWLFTIKDQSKKVCFQ